MGAEAGARASLIRGRARGIAGLRLSLLSDEEEGARDSDTLPREASVVHEDRGGRGCSRYAYGRWVVTV